MGVSLILRHPNVAYRPCSKCILYDYNHETGEQKKDKKTGRPKRRPVGQLPPCHWNPDACPKGSPSERHDLRIDSAIAYRHYIECKAVGDFESDSIVKRNAGIIRQIEDSVEAEGWGLIKAYLTGGGAKPDPFSELRSTGNGQNARNHQRRPNKGRR